MLKIFKQPSEFHWIDDKRGAAAITVMIIVLAMALIVISTTAMIGTDNLDIGYSAQASNDALLSAESCAEEALVRLSRDSNYSGGSLTIGSAQCSIIITGVPCGNCVIDVEAVRDDYTRSVQVGVTVTGTSIDITDWAEVN
jgi:hypothetical protein